MDISGLIEESNKIDTKLDNLLEEAKGHLVELDSRLILLNEEYKRAKADGDLRENASYEESIKRIQEAQGDRVRWEVLSDGISNVKIKIRDYVHQEKITILSTVYMKKISGNAPNMLEDSEDSFLFKLFPYGISDVEAGMLSIDSVIGGKLLGKQKGDVIKLRDRSSGRYANYEVVSFY